MKETRRFLRFYRPCRFRTTGRANRSSQRPKKPITFTVEMRGWIDGVADSENFVFMPKIDFLGDMTPSISRKTFPPMAEKVGGIDE